MRRPWAVRAWAPWLALYLILLGVVWHGLPGGRSDDAEIMLHTQAWAWGYRLRNPPLFEWLSMAVMAWSGPQVKAVIGLRLACLVGMLALLYRLGRQMSLPSRAALAAALAVALVPQFYYYALVDLTHTVLAGLFYVLLPMAVMHARASPTVGRAALVGLVVGLGLLTKHVFALYVLAAVLACAIVPGYRVLWQVRCLFTALAVALLTVAPYALWCVMQGGEAFAMQRQESLHTGQAWQAAGALTGTLRLAQMVVTVSLPWLLVWFLGLASPRAWRKPPAGEDARWLTWTVAGSVVTMALVWGVMGAQRVEAHHLMFLALAPLALMSMVVRTDVLPRRLKALSGVSVLFALVVVPVLFWVDSERTSQRCESCGPYLDYPLLAARLRQAGVTQGTLYFSTHARHLAVPSLRPDLPQVHLVRVDVPLTESPSRVSPAPETCALIWLPGDEPALTQAGDRRRLPPGLFSAWRSGRITARWGAPVAGRARPGQDVSVLVQHKGCA